VSLFSLTAKESESNRGIYRTFTVTRLINVSSPDLIDIEILISGRRKRRREEERLDSRELI